MAASAPTRPARARRVPPRAPHAPAVALPPGPRATAAPTRSQPGLADAARPHASTCVFASMCKSLRARRIDPTAHRLLLPISSLPDPSISFALTRRIDPTARRLPLSISSSLRRRRRRKPELEVAVRKLSISIMSADPEASAPSPQRSISMGTREGNASRRAAHHRSKPLSARPSTNRSRFTSRPSEGTDPPGTLVMCLRHSRPHLSPDEQLAAEKDFGLYCKPVEMYNIIQRRTIKNVNFILQLQPTFIQRSLIYKIQSRRKKEVWQVGHVIGGGNYPGNYVEGSSLQKLEGKCYWGKIATHLLTSALEKVHTRVSLGLTIELASTVTMRSSFLEILFLCMQPKFLEQDNCLTFCSHKVDDTGSYQLKVCIHAEEVGSRDLSLSPYSNYSYNDAEPSILPEIIRLRAGNVLFNYKYYDNTMQKTEVTEDFSCPFCLVTCGSFKGLGRHLNSSHDLFRFEFWISEECQAINVRLKNDDRKTELLAEGVDPRHQTFSYRSKFKRRRQLETTAVKFRHVHSHDKESGSQEDAQAGSKDDYVQRENDALVDPSHTVHGSIFSPPTMLQFGKTRKLSVEQSDLRIRQLLRKRQFFHAHKAQPMALEQLFSDHDSEDEVDDDIADFEDGRMLDDFVDFTKDEKLIMRMWNSFVRKQRSVVLADGHIPWVCEAFSRCHGQHLVQKPALLWGWRFFMIKLWNHSLLDAHTMNTCNIILQGYQEGSSDPK
nr:unnamed protein product [Digitaria exilis]